MYEYMNTQRYFAQCADDIQQIVCEELESLGAEKVKAGYRGIYFNASKEVLYSVNFRSALITRVLAPLISFNCHSDNYLYKTALAFNWSDFLKNDKTFAVFSSVSHSRIRHSKFAALRLKDAIVDYFKNKTGKRPDVDTRDPDVWFNLHIENNRALISLDTSGGSLHRRGYRKESVTAPMAETVAASIIRLSGWDGTTPLYDPMCGSGTLLCEAWLHATGTPPALLRKKFGFMRLPDYDPAAWEKAKSSVKIKKLPQKYISGSDISREAADAARGNSSLLDKSGVFEIFNKDLFSIEKITGKTIITNPPYGIRLKDKEETAVFYKRLGDFLKNRCAGSTAYIYFGDRAYLKHIGLKPSFKKILANGGLDGRLAKFELY